MTYHRTTEHEKVLNLSGYAMFADGPEEVVGSYGANYYTYDGEGAVSIESLSEIIREEWNECQRISPESFPESADEIIEWLNPERITAGAGGWDLSSEIAVGEWFTDFIATPKNIKAVILNDGCILFDASLAKFEGKLED